MHTRRHFFDLHLFLWKLTLTLTVAATCPVITLTLTYLYQSSKLTFTLKWDDLQWNTSPHKVTVWTDSSPTRLVMVTHTPYMRTHTHHTYIHAHTPYIHTHTPYIHVQWPAWSTLFVQRTLICLLHTRFYSLHISMQGAFPPHCTCTLTFLVHCQCATKQIASKFSCSACVLIRCPTCFAFGAEGHVTVFISISFHAKTIHIFKQVFKINHRLTCLWHPVLPLRSFFESLWTTHLFCTAVCC